jgi:hypothetical protein
MNPTDLQRLKEAFQAAAQRVPDQIVYQLLGKPPVSMKQMADEVANETPTGRRMIEIYEREMAETNTTVNDVVAYLKTGQKPPQVG